MLNSGIVQAYDYTVINNDYYLFHNQLPVGPVQLLVPGDRIKISYFDYDNKIQAVHAPFTNGKWQIAFFSVPQKEEVWNLLRSISLLNTIVADIAVYCSGKCIKSIKQYTNSHITLHNLDAVKTKVKITANVIITHSLGALYFIKQKIPVLVAGPHGLGGWVTPDNFSFLSREGFSGRPGGQLWETIPAAVLADELSAIQNDKHMAEILEKNAALAGQLPYFPHSKSNKVIAELNRHYNRITNTSARWNLIPAFAADILFRPKNDKYCITRTSMNDTLAVVEDTSFFRLIDGKNNFKQLYKLSEMDKDDFWELIHSLIQQKIIVF